MLWGRLIYAIDGTNLLLLLCFDGALGLSRLEDLDRVVSVLKVNECWFYQFVVVVPKFAF